MRLSHGGDDGCFILCLALGTHDFLFLETLSSLTQLSLSCSLDVAIIFWSHIYLALNPSLSDL